MKVRVAILSLLAVVACAKKEEPKTVSGPVAQAVQQAERMSAQIEAETGTPVGSMTLTFVEPSEEDYIGLIVAAAGWARKSVRSLGILQQTTGHPLWAKASLAATQKYALRPIQPSDYSVVCGQPDRKQTSIANVKEICTMKHVDAVMQFNSVRLTRDSGYVALGVTRVPSGATRAETVYQCVSIARKGNEWEARRADRVADWQLCPRGRR
jgi:hypothetical protein